MVFVSICEQANSVFSFSSKSSDQIIFRAPSTLENADGELQAIRNFSAYRNLFCFKKGNVVSHQVIWLPSP